MLVAVREAGVLSSVAVLLAIAAAGAVLYAAVYVAVGATRAERAFYRSLTISAGRTAAAAFRRS
jgi:hypothetical protein